MVSEISFGTIPILSGNVPVLPSYYSPDEKEAVEIMKYAFELGCNLYDTAIVPEYGDAEYKLGIFAEQIGREKIIISDKARFFEGNEMYEAVCQSCEHLNTTPDIYFVHQVDEENQEKTFARYGAVDALTELKREGKIKLVGIASHYFSVLHRGLNDPRVDVLQGSGNILERGMLDRITREQNLHKKGILINKVYAAGILTSFFRVDQLIGGVLSYPISSALIGIGTFEQAKKAMSIVFKQYDRLTFQEVLCELERSFSPIPCDRCQRCRCVYGTEISILFRQYNYYFMGKEYWALRKLDLGIRESAEYCKKCTDLSCMRQCPYKIRIPERIQAIKELVEIYVRNGRI